MDAWLTDVKQIRIPRPKYNNVSASSSPCKIPRDEPPRDYDLDLTKNCRQETQKAQMDAEDLQRAFQEKL
ncbi:CLUMA_CG019536, isoform A [Clunio marinus]|uniref:CLUMA_CG019536, isoform A n=1 Tax=Clunio marinus TaxID=568069 RepID=A0A1J1J6C2_9DIPT|nr:CLUMA_CG019536, isoform A [Clunio marinus]